MKKTFNFSPRNIIVFVIALSLASGCCGNSDLDGVWLILSDPPIQDDTECYLKSDGHGTIIDRGSFNPGDPPGTYAVSGGCPECSLSLAFYSTEEPPTGASGTLTCPDKTEGTIEIPGYGFTGIITKVPDLSVFEGEWCGTLTEQTSGDDHSIEFTVDSTGQIGDLRFDGASVGTTDSRIFCKYDRCQGFLRTELADEFNQIHIAGTLDAESLSGSYYVDEDEVPPIVSGTIELESCQAGAWFTDETASAGLTDKKGFRTYAVDLNNDDYPDLVVLNGTPTNRNNLSLFLNEQAPGSKDRTDRLFVDVTEISGINANPDPGEEGRQSNLASFADVDNDDDVDLVTCLYYHRIEDHSDYVAEDRCEVLLNNGDAIFTIKENNGLHELGLINATGFSFLDYDKDGSVDLFIGTYFEDYTQEIWGYDILVRGNGDGTFLDVSDESGITGIEAPLYGTNVTDWNNDGWPDILTSPYCRTGGSLWRNLKNGTFFDVAGMFGYDAHTMSGDGGQPLCQWAAQPADFDNDGDFDLYLALIHGGTSPGEGRSTIVVNNGPSGGYGLEWELDRITWDDPQSSHRRDHYGVWFDMDNDGLTDLGVTQCASDDSRDKLFFLHQQENHYFDDITDDLGFTGEGRIKSPHALSVFDYDLDGDDDIVAGLYREGSQLLLLENRIANSNNHVSVRLVPPAGVNQSAIGARITVTSGDLVQTREIYAGQGNFSNQSPFLLNFGLGGRTSVDSIAVSWPGISIPETIVEDPPINEIVTVAGITSWK